MDLRKAIDLFKQHLNSKERSKQTVRGYYISLQDFLHYIERTLNGKVYLDEILLEHLEAYLIYRKDLGDQPISRNRALYIFRSFYQFLVKRELVEKDISQNLEPIKYQQKERPHLTMDEVQVLLSAIEHPLIRVAVTTLAYTGLRVSELCDLKIEDVNLSDKLLQVIEGKGKKNRTVPINDKLQEVLEDYLLHKSPDSKSPYFFSTTKTGRLSPQYINYCLRKTTKKLGWKNRITAHIMRHSFASNLVRNNAPLPSVQSLLGHSDLRVTSRYLHQKFNELTDAVNLL